MNTVKQLELITEVLACDEITAKAIYEVIEDYFDVDYSETTIEDFKVTILAANQLMPEVL